MKKGVFMSVDFDKSITKENLMRAFAGESQARNRYTFAASIAKSQKLHVIEAIFTFTANQEKEHGEIFYNYLKEFSGENIMVDGSYPVDLHDSVAKLLRAAQHNEYEEHDDTYMHFSEKASEEGFTNIANSFKMIGEIEKSHGDRFGRFAELLENNELFVSEVTTGWMCLNCGHITTSKEAPNVCPVCDHNQGYFIRLELAPYQN
jgi:rubrerythrin